MYSEPDNVSRLTTPLNAATPSNCRALARNPTVTGSSELRSNPKVILPLNPAAVLQSRDLALLTRAANASRANIATPLVNLNNGRAKSVPYRYLRVGQYCDVCGYRSFADLHAYIVTSMIDASEDQRSAKVTRWASPLIGPYKITHSCGAPLALVPLGLQKR